MLLKIFNEEEIIIEITVLFSVWRGSFFTTPEMRFNDS